ncbi:Nod-factor receptor 5 [Medicago truncatula]|uniref:Nod-factor receptor 5 n=1 Tax=Medicago truncatula TaxID=3880 RepID=G7LFJ9_MEDTR|nr:Nod-factor receptor 5 [Medicago truncatula]
MLTVGTKIVIPLFCNCPSNYQFAKGIEFLITYVWQSNDNLALVAAKFSASPHDITTANGKNFGQNFTAATNFPVFIPVKNLLSLS